MNPVHRIVTVPVFYLTFTGQNRQRKSNTVVNSVSKMTMFEAKTLRSESQSRIYITFSVTSTSLIG